MFFFLWSISIIFPRVNFPLFMYIEHTHGALVVVVARDASQEFCESGDAMQVTWFPKKRINLYTIHVRTPLYYILQIYYIYKTRVHKTKTTRTGKSANRNDDADVGGRRGRKRVRRLRLDCVGDGDVDGERLFLNAARTTSKWELAAWQQPVHGAAQT